MPYHSAIQKEDRELQLIIAKAEIIINNIKDFQFGKKVKKQHTFSPSLLLSSPSLKNNPTIVNPINTIENISQFISECERHLKHAKNLIQRIEIETRDMSTEERADVRRILKERANTIKEIKSELKWIKVECSSQIDRSPNLLVNGNVSNLNHKQYENYNDLTDMYEEEIYDYAENIQNEDISILDRVILNIEETNKVWIDCIFYVF